MQKQGSMARKPTNGEKSMAYALIVVEMTQWMVRCVVQSAEQKLEDCTCNIGKNTLAGQKHAFNGTWMRDFAYLVGIRWMEIHADIVYLVLKNAGLGSKELIMNKIDLINKQEFIKYLECTCSSPCNCDTCGERGTKSCIRCIVEWAIERVPVVEKKRGKWINPMGISIGGDCGVCAICSVCGKEIVLWESDNYCPSCGAEMELCQ